MAIEFFTYISTLNINNPVGGIDPYSTADDHLRGIKKALKNSFANVAGAVTSLHTDLNLVSGGVAAGVTAAKFQRLSPLTSAIIQEAQRNVASGFAGLDAGAKVLVGNLPVNMPGINTATCDLADDSLKLGGVVAASWARVNVGQTFSGTQTFGNIIINGTTTLTDTVLISATSTFGSTVTFNGNAVFNASMRLLNNVPFQVRNVDSTLENAIKMSVANELEIGSASTDMNIFALSKVDIVAADVRLSAGKKYSGILSGTEYDLIRNSATGTIVGDSLLNMQLRGGVIEALTGYMLTANAQGYWVKSSGGNARELLNLTASNNIKVGSDSGLYGMTLYATSAQLAADFIGAPASFILQNTAGFQIRDTGGTARTLVHISSGDNTTLGNIAVNTILTGLTIALPNGKYLDLPNGEGIRAETSAAALLNLLTTSAGDLVNVGNASWAGIQLLNSSTTRREVGGSAQREVGYAYNQIATVNSARTLLATDLGKMLRMTGFFSVTLPTEATLSLPIGFYFYLWNNHGAIQWAVEPAVGVTMYNQFDVGVNLCCRVVKVDTNTWIKGIQ